MLVELSNFYPVAHFGDAGARGYFDALIASRFAWHYKQLEPGGPGSGGTIVLVQAGGRVIDDLERTVADMVSSLTHMRDDFNYNGWRQEWTDRS